MDTERPQHKKDVDELTQEKLEEMWDRQILKGDDEFYENRFCSRHQNPPVISEVKDESGQTRRIKNKRKF